ncbi:Peritrophin-1 [Chionoecetes opilio]|uniref:Peritrophin-1 n=1 Tax=Chionoecetes opilio TaxID=41210 RepID=A0A8J8WF59_CHIOP|nr:Peritrophin-1 [Chionoecetes opilio]
MMQKFSITGVSAALGLLLLAVHAQGLQVCPSLSCPTPSGFFAHPSDCGTYVTCSDGDVDIKQCPEGLHFNPVQRRCDYPKLVQCAPYGPQPMPCGKGTIWDQRLLTCNHEDITPCVTGNYEDSDGSCTFPTFTTTTTRSPGTVSTTTTPSGSVCDVTCPTPVGLFPHPWECTEWVHCDHNIPYVKDCPAGLHFNAQLKDAKECIGERRGQGAGFVLDGDAGELSRRSRGCQA